MRTPEVSTIYAAFDRRTHDIYRAALVHARDGLVRVSHVLAGCQQVVPELMAAASIPQPVLPSLVSGRMTAMTTNESAVRDVLRLAYELAANQPVANEGWITPQIFLAAIVLCGHGHPRDLPAEICNRLQVRVGDFIRPAMDQRIDIRLEVAPSAEVLTEMYDAGLTLADQILEIWLKARESPPGPMREALLVRVDQLRLHL